MLGLTQLALLLAFLAPLAQAQSKYFILIVVNLTLRHLKHILESACMCEYTS